MISEKLFRKLMCVSPFAFLLKRIRTEKLLQQKDLAAIIGCEPSYLSALETDSKVPPQNEKLVKFFKKLNWADEQINELITAAQKSKRILRLPMKAKSQVFEICYALEKQLPYLSDVQLDLIAIALRINTKETSGECQK